MRITTTPAGCSYRNPDCGANEFCSDNTCVVRECNSSRQCGNGTGCNAFSCSDYKCVNYVQPGCEYGDKCYNYGNRPTIGNLTYYCGIDRKLSVQKKNETACTDAFECESNFCLDGTCKEKPTLTSIADGITEFLRGIIRWAQSLFETSSDNGQPVNLNATNNSA
jgi:hypothetical protein